MTKIVHTTEQDVKPLNYHFNSYSTTSKRRAGHISDDHRE